MSSSEPTPSSATPRHRLLLPFWAWVLIAAGLAIGILQFTNVTYHGAANFFSEVIALAAGVLILAWFLAISGYSWRTRLLGLLAVAAALGAARALLRFDGVTGDMVPMFSWRWTPTPEEQLGEARPAGGVVDLATSTPDDFPQFLGPDRRAAVEQVSLARDWSARPPRLVWKQPIGPGWSGFAVVNGQAVTLEQRGEQELVTCYDLKTGKLQWAQGITGRHESVPGGVGPRSTPAIDGGNVYAMGATGRLRCLDGGTGQPIWEKDLLKEYGIDPAEETARLPWGRAASPLVLGDRVIVPVGGPAGGRQVTLAAFDKLTGKLLWEAGQRYLSYSSPALATLGGVEQVLAVSEEHVSGHDPATGQVLWEFEWPGTTNQAPNASQPVPLGPDRLWVSKGYGQGAAVWQVSRSGGGWSVQPLWHRPESLRTKFTNVVVYDGLVYGLSEGILECVDPVSGQRVWKGDRYGHGQVLRVGGLLLVLSEKGEVFLIELTAERPNHVLGRFPAIEGKTWNNFALSGPYLLVRNAEEAACYELP